MAGGSKTQTKYPDLRYLFIRGLVALETFQRTRHYLKSAAECTLRAVVSLDLSEHPVKSIKQAGTLEGIGAEIKRKLQSIYEEKRFNLESPVRGKYCSSASAILVALLEITEKKIIENHGEDDCILVEEAALRIKTQQISEEKLIDNNSDENCFCQAWWRLEVLIKRNLVKRRSLNKSPVYQLLPLGKETAHRLRGTNQLTVITMATPISQPITKGIESDQAAPWVVPVSKQRNPKSSLYTNDTGEEGIIILIDTQEWGEDRQSLGDLCRLFEEAGIRYQSRHLKSGDYCWIWRCDGVDRYLPCLVERKRADDMANSLKDGRFWKQITKMVEWKKRFKDHGLECLLYYMVEGEPEQFIVRCADGCQGVGKCGNPNLTQVKCAFRDLKSHPELVVQTTDNIESTVVLLASITSELQTRMMKGEFDEMIVKELSGNVLLQKDGPSSLSDVVKVVRDKSDFRESQDVKIVQKNRNMKQKIKENNGKNKQVKSSAKSWKDIKDEIGCSFNESDNTPNYQTELDIGDDIEVHSLEPLAQDHGAEIGNEWYSRQQFEPTNHMSYHPKIKRSDKNSAHSFSNKKITPSKRKIPADKNEMPENSSMVGKLVTTPLITEKNDGKPEIIFSPKKFKLNITPSVAFTESLKNYTPPSSHRKGEVKSKPNSKCYRKQSKGNNSEDEITSESIDTLYQSKSHQRYKLPGSKSKLLKVSHFDQLPGIHSQQSSFKCSGKHTCEFLPDNADMKLDMNENRSNAPCGSLLFSDNKNSDQYFSDSDSDSLPDLQTIVTNKKLSHGYFKDNNGNTSQIKCDLNKQFLSKRKIDQKQTDNLYCNYEIENSAISFVDVRNDNFKTLCSENSNPQQDENYTDHISLIQTVLPHVTPYKARTMLKKYRGNIDLCVAAFLDSCSPVEGPVVDLA